jgi:GDPmannose 4,6-dehydratase
MKKALITGITGQDGSYLTELLLEKGYEVHGTVRRSSSFNTGRIDHIYLPALHDPGRRLFLHYADLNDASSLNRVLRVVQPDEIYNLGAQSHVKVSFDTPDYTAEVTGLGAMRLLEAVRELERPPRIYQASSSEMFGKAQEIPQNETTPFYPRSPYGVAKLFAYWTTVNFREAYGLYAVNGILFNHESPRRGENFVTRKISRAAGRFANGSHDALEIGNLEAERDWGYAKDYVDAMWRMLQQDEPDDYVVATGEVHSVREFCERAFHRVQMTLRWKGSGADEIGYDAASGRTLVVVDPRYFRPTEVDRLQGDAAKARTRLRWKPTVTFGQLVDLMVDADVALAAREAAANPVQEIR